MLAQQRVKLAGHSGRKIGDLVIFYGDPLAVRARQHQPRIAQAKDLKCAENLRFLATHHVRDGVVINAQAGHDGDAAGLHPCKPGRNVAESGWAGALGRL